MAVGRHRVSPGRMINVPALIGIDIGWSEGRASCGIATSSPDLPFPERATRRYGNGESPVRAARLRLSALIDCLRHWSESKTAYLSDAVVVIDGPLGPDGPPEADRAVDDICGTGLFRGWAQPTRITHPSSRLFIEATYSVLSALGGPTIWVPGRAAGGLMAVETNPTVALAALMPRIPTEHIVSRKRPFLLDGAVVTAKSDWYWRNGAGHSIASALASGSAREEIKNETDHELCAALVCLALAHQFTGTAVDGTTSIALGDRAGVYLLPGNIDQSWEQGFPGHCHGEPVYVAHSASRHVFWGKAHVPVARERDFGGGTPRRLAQTEASSRPPEERPPQPGSDLLSLMLSDSGSVWAKHNPWLCGLNSPVRIAVDGQPDFEIELTPARTHASSGQWTAEPKPSIIAARSGADQRGHLSLKNAVKIQVRIRRAGAPSDVRG